jgi:REP element-mobilizing transposase RayT
MPNSHTSLHYHVIFATKGRQPLIGPDWRERLFMYIGGIARDLPGSLLAAGAMPDHVHLLLGLHPTVAVSNAMRDIKAGSSKWIHETFANKRHFAWQDGYGAFAVSYSQLEGVRLYIANQEEHHRGQTFEQEFAAFLQRHQIPYDPRYIWS